MAHAARRKPAPTRPRRSPARPRTRRSAAPHSSTASGLGHWQPVAAIFLGLLVTVVLGRALSQAVERGDEPLPAALR